MVHWLPLIIMTRAVVGAGASATLVGVQAMLADLTHKVPQHVGKFNSMHQASEIPKKLYE